MEKLTRHMRKKRVDECLIEPLKAMGMRKQHRFRVEDQEAFYAQLRGRLAYMSAEGLEVLRAMVEGNATGQRKNVWPDFISIVNWAKAIEAVPDGENEMITSYMASAAGREAWARGPEYAMALHGWMRRCGRPPNSYAWKHELEGRAAKAHRESARVIALVDAGKARADERDWLDGFSSHKRHVEKLVYPQANESGANEN